MTLSNFKNLVINSDMDAVTITKCTVCESQFIVKTAVKWCFECDEAFCSDCLKYHSNTKLTKTHAVIDVSDLQELPKFVLNIKHHCEEHEALFQNYCLSHERPCCRKCINSTHKNCTDLPPLDEAIKNVRSSTALEDLPERLQNLKKYLEGICHEKESNATKIRTQAKNILTQITSIRLKLNQHLDGLEREIRQKVFQLENKSLNSIEKILQELKVKDIRIDELSNGFKKMRTHASELQIFLGTKECELEIYKHEKEIEDLQRGLSLYLSSINFHENSKISAFNFDVTSLGDLDIEVTPSMTKYLKQKEQQGQNLIERKGFDDIELNLVTQLTFKGKKVFGTSILENDIVCFADRNTNVLTVKTTNESMVFRIELPTTIYGIACINDQTLAVTTGYNENKILVVNLMKRSVEKIIKTENYCCGISFSDGKLIHNSSKLGLLSLNLENDIVTKLDIGYRSPDVYVALHDNKIYCTDNTSSSVRCYNSDKTLAWELNDKLLVGPRGIAVDKNGIVYVGDQDGGNVVIISPDGNKHKVIKIDSISKPRTLSFNKARTRLLICGVDGQSGIFVTT
ncbi:uncharacterized protein LOC134699976 [Mytilus trossulus]|uniref:uncharacterized protein LOC134699976 n=1 Tax=Mytilus trossulus TaxID=6551 RepID=UPI0030045466